MSSLQDQLLKAGLADSNKAKKIHSDKRKQTKAAHKTKQKTVDHSHSTATQLQVKHAERDKLLNRQIHNKSHQKAIAAQIIQLIHTHKVDREKGEITYGFVHEKKVKSILVTETIQNQLSRGNLAIVNYQKNKQSLFEVVPTIVARKITERDDQCVVHINLQGCANEQEDDPYADYKIPDDLMW